MADEGRGAAAGGPGAGPLVCPHCGVAFPPDWPGAGRGFIAHVLEYLATGACYFLRAAGDGRRAGGAPPPLGGGGQEAR